MGIELLFLTLALAILLRSAVAFLNGRGSAVLVGAISASVYLFCLYIPAKLQASGDIESKLVKQGFASAPVTAEVSGLSGWWIRELAVIVVAEFLVVLTFRHAGQVQRGRKEASIDRAKAVALILIFVGISAYVIFPPPALENRADEGQGLGNILRGFLICGLAFLLYHRAFGRRWVWVFLGLSTIGLASLNVRSPLIVLFFAVFVIGLEAKWFQKWNRLALLAVGVIVLSIIGSTMSNLRENETRRYGYSTVEVVESTLADPWAAAYGAGIDTLDGYRFSMAISNREPAHPESILAVGTTLVPRAIWSNKPESLSVEMSRKYLGYRASGQFLSPVGYFVLAFGGYTSALIALAIFVAVASWAVHRAAGSFWLVVILVVVFRFMLGGSPFDIYYGITLAIPVVVSYLLLWAAQPSLVGAKPSVT